MRTRLSRLRLSPAVVISGIALFFAIGGIGYAATKIGTDDLKDGAVTKKKVASEAINSKRVKDKTIKYKDLKFDADSLVGPEGPQGQQGPQGPQGPAGPANVDVDKKAEIATAQASPSLANGGVVPLAVNEGFAWAVVCQAPAPGVVASLLVVQNLSGGDDSHLTGAYQFRDENLAPLGDRTNDFDQTQVAVVASAGPANNVISRSGSTSATTPPGSADQGASVLIYGTNGQTQMGQGGVLNNPTGYPGDPDCVGSLNLLAK